jgi:hypothetical protein
MTLVDDASVAIKWLINEPDHISARALLAGMYGRRALPLRLGVVLQPVEDA